MNESTESQYQKELSESHPAVIKLKEGRVFDVTNQELTHPRIIHFYNQLMLLFTSLSKELYEDCIEKLRRINNSVDLEIYLNNLETKYRESLIKGNYNSREAAEKAHIISKAGRKVWYRMKTNFDTIEELHRKRIEYIQSLGNYLYDNSNIRKIVDLMLMIKDLATGTDGYESDMDLAFSFDVKNNAAARAIAINALEPVITKFELTRTTSRPPKTAHIDWKDQVYATSWLRSVADQRPSQEQILERIQGGFKTNTYTRRFLTETIFGFKDTSPLSVPIYPISKREIYDELMIKFTQPKLSILYQGLKNLAMRTIGGEYARV